MKKAVLFTIILVLSSVFSFAQTTQKIGFVDVNLIMAQYSKSIKAQSDFEALQTAAQATYQKMGKELQDKAADLQKKMEKMTDVEKKKVTEDFAAEQVKLNSYSQEEGQKLQAKRAELFKPVIDAISKTISEIAKAEKLSFVLNKESELTILLYADEAFDVTYKVLDKLKTGK